MPKRPRTSIRVGQRLHRWDGEPGYVALNSRGIRVHTAGDAFQVLWTTRERVPDTRPFNDEGVQGQGVMPWHARSPPGAPQGAPLTRKDIRMSALRTLKFPAQPVGVSGRTTCRPPSIARW